MGESGAPDTAPGTALVVNGQHHVMARSATVADLVSCWCPSPDGIAVARNREVVPRSEWTTTVLCSHDVVEIVTAAAGG